MTRAGPAAATLALLAALAAAPAEAACGLELVLATDVSGSIDEREFRLQADGIADAFEHPSVIAAVAELEGGMLVTLTQWSGLTRQSQAVAWHHVGDAAGLAALAAEIRGMRRSWRNFSTAIGEALEHARNISAEAPQTCRRRVIDVSGDGVSNEGRRPRAIADAIAAAGYTINGLVIRGADPDPFEEYRLNVIAGPGAFIEIAESFEDYPRAILRKLLREIDQPVMVSERPSPAPPAGP